MARCGRRCRLRRLRRLRPKRPARIVRLGHLARDDASRLPDKQERGLHMIAPPVVAALSSRASMNLVPLDRAGVLSSGPMFEPARQLLTEFVDMGKERFQALASTGTFDGVEPNRELVNKFISGERRVVQLDEPGPPGRSHPAIAGVQELADAHGIYTHYSTSPATANGDVLWHSLLLASTPEDLDTARHLNGLVSNHPMTDTGIGLSFGFPKHNIAFYLEHNFGYEGMVAALEGAQHVPYRADRAA